MSDRKPVMGFTMGDPAGIGPEILAAGWPALTSDKSHQYVVFGDVECLRRAVICTAKNVIVQPIESLLDAFAEPSTEMVMRVLPCGPPQAALAPLGQVSALAGEAAFAYLQAAITAAQNGTIDAIVTAPLNKESIRMAGKQFPGHTEILAERCGVEEFAMMLYIPEGQDVGGDMGTGVVHTTLHQSLRQALDELSSEQILSKCKLAHQFANACLQNQGLSRAPRIAVAALNPHAGENGLFGDEETRIIAPAIAQARQLGIDCHGPFSCDTLMGRAVAGEFDMVVAMYHDQGHIALKLLGMHKAVNVTLGLPIIRTSVAHGTAFEIAGTGQADPTSLFRAIEVAKRLVNQSLKKNPVVSG
ncbi:MAG: 4-hydroxythreonine-4-phosphate dehydrogenase PdxA [Pirellulaceae bacterium]|nr:4-hydroxythreonine-4-phosphate dehydrogenase PdxA [Pirellulaceae bacterium]